MYKVKVTGPSTEPRGTPYESVSLFFYGLVPILQIGRKPNLSPADKYSKVRAVTSPLSILVMMLLYTFRRADSVKLYFL